MLIVQKYGGSSVGSLERIRNCAARVLATQRAGHEVVVVVSAMSGETNRLIALANQLAALERGPEADALRGGKGPYVASERAGDRDHERELDQLVCTGENVSAALLAMALQNAGGAAISLVGPQIGMRTD
ncbi:MAG TPA: aspartate kinase, partial [Nannocystis sp.]